jgi:hypothetical protein
MLVYLVLYYKILPNKINKLNYVNLFGFEYVLWIHLIGKKIHKIHDWNIVVSRKKNDKLMN